MMIRAIVLASLLAATPATAQVVVHDQLVNMTCSAAARCQGEETPEPDVQYRWITAVTDVDESPVAEMVSACSSSIMSSSLQLSYLDDRIEASLGAASDAQGLLGGYGNVLLTIQIRVETPTTYTLTCNAQISETGESDLGSTWVNFFGGAVDHDTMDEDTFSHEWQGTLQPGVNYVLGVYAESRRVVRDIDGTIVGNEGTSTRSVTVSLVFDGLVVDAAPVSIGSVKARY